MTITVFIPTGEVRPAKTGEKYRNDNGEIIKATYNYDKNDLVQIGTVHNIEVPEGATELSIYENQPKPLQVCPKTFLYHLSIPMPKRKVKKWQWLYRSKEGYFYLTGFFYTNKTSAALKTVGEVIRPVEETMIEVEE
jgi:hypothetical protein